MYLGKTLFAQAMDFLPWKTFHRKRCFQATFLSECWAA